MSGFEEDTVLTTMGNTGCSLGVILPQVSLQAGARNCVDIETNVHPSRHFVPSVTIPLRGAPHSISASC